MGMTPEEQRALAIECGYVDAPTVRIAYQGFHIAAYTAAVEAKERAKYATEALNMGKCTEACVFHDGSKQAEIDDLRRERDSVEMSKYPVENDEIERLNSIIAELTRKLAEHQAVFHKMASAIRPDGLRDSDKLELNVLLAKERDNIHKKLIGFIAQQKDLPVNFVKTVNDNFFELLQ